jgi:D-psicose/D-tagatose/L-ribulose 3-epimerase
MPARLAISNIAWPAERDVEVLTLLERHGVTDLEIAPTRLWPQPAAVPIAEVYRYRDTLAGRGFRIIGAQSLLFGRPDLTVFENMETTGRTIEYLESIIRVCAALGAEAMVFGSPKNRQIGSLPQARAWQLAAEVFASLAAIAERHGTVVVIEANPRAYQADFLIHASEAAELVRRVNRPGLRLHLDTACMTMADDDIDNIFCDHSQILYHFHVSEPYLAAVNGATVDHARFAEHLRRCNYDRWVSIEMRAPDPFSPEVIDSAIVWARRVYLGVG